MFRELLGFLSPFLDEPDITVLAFLPRNHWSPRDDVGDSDIKAGRVLLVTLPPGLPSMPTHPAVTRVVGLNPTHIIQNHTMDSDSRIRTFSHNCWYSRFPVLPPLSLNGIFSAMYSHRCCSSEVVNCVRLSPQGQEGIDGGSNKEYPLLSRASSTRVLVNRRCIRDPSRSYAFADPLKMLYIFPGRTLVLLYQLHECGRLVIGEDDARLSLRSVRVAAGMLFFSRFDACFM